MSHIHNYLLSAGAIAALALAACTDDLLPTPDNNDLSLPIRFEGEITQEAVTRANDNGFADGDQMGVYVVDYNGLEPGTLLTKGNRGDNVRHTFNEAAYRWASAYDLYWKDKHTAIDVYGYYPFGSPENVNSYPFTVRTDQTRTYSNGTMGDYEASDFLWGKATGIQPTSSVVRLPLQHRMANARVTLTEGSGFADGEWSKLEKQVLVTNTVQDATIDLATGTVTPSGSVGEKAIIPSVNGDEWRAIVVPQTIGGGITLFSITLGGVPYKFSKPEGFEYVSGKMSNFTIRIDKKELSGTYSLTLTGESITPWENDLVSHDASLKEYVIVNSTAGGLKESIEAAGKNYATIKNLKITGEMDANDFTFINQNMTKISALNLKEVRIISKPDTYYSDSYGNDEIPRQALYNNETLTRIILPDKLKKIRDSAFHLCSKLTGSLIIPEGVTDIGNYSFSDCGSLNGTLTLPKTLKSIGQFAFRSCSFTSELNLPPNLEEIGPAAFMDCRSLYGNLILPDKIKKIGYSAFLNCKKLTGSLRIPQGLHTIEQWAFGNCGFNGILQLHDGITSIASKAFCNCRFKGELTLPKNIEMIGEQAFIGCQFSGKLTLPSTLTSIGASAFSENSRLSGILDIPEGIECIKAGAFAGCSNLEGVILPKSLDIIDDSAFARCYNLGSIVCKNSTPPYVMDGAFSGVPKDNFTVEVPSAAVNDYQTAKGWYEFKRIAAHHELVCTPSATCALSSARTQTLTLRAEGDWEVESKPDWCTLSKMSGSKKELLTLSINRFDDTSGVREGDIVFRLKGKEYTHTCHVTQHGYQYNEDQYVTLQKASAGSRGGINLIFVGDGYNSKEITDGTYLKDMQTAMEHFFAVEPYATYRRYFNVYSPIALSTESGIGSVNTIRYNRFNTTFTAGVGLKCDNDEIFDYALKAPTVNSSNLGQTLIVLVPNTTEYAGITHMWADGSAIAICPKSSDPYPYDFRGIVQHEAGGHGFGKLGDEYIYHNAFIDQCDCIDCPHNISYEKGLGWYDNIELTGKINKVGWSHLIFDPRYSDIVDVYEGAFMHTRGVYRSEQNSCMNNNIPYFNTISRESIVKRIKRYAGETFNFEDFVASDKRSTATRSRAAYSGTGSSTSAAHQHAPVIHKENPLSKLRKQGKKLK